MDKKSKNITTNQLWTRLLKSSSVERFFASYEPSYELPTFSEYITSLCKARGEKPGAVIRLTNIDPSYGHRIFSGERRPSRDTVIQLAFGLRQNADEAQQMLKCAREAALHPRVKRDAIIAYCLQNHKTLMYTQQVLVENNLPVIGGRENV